jgi:ribonuclease BN (tRNA processing enzyme)
MRGVELRCLGTGDAFGSGGRLPTATLLSASEGRVLVDCGPATLPALRAASVDPNAIDVLLLTHLHGDHFGGVPFFLMDAHYAAARTRPLVIAGPVGAEATIAQALALLFPGSGGLAPGFAVTYLEWRDGEGVSVGPARATPRAVRHSTHTPCFGLRVEFGGRVVAFSGDTEWTDALVGLASGADVFLCECSGYDSAPPGHLDFLTLEQHRQELECRRLLLTHLGDDMLARAAALPVETTRDGFVLDL